MQWIQRNLFYVVWGGLAAALTAVAFVFWYSGYQRNTDLDAKLEAEKQHLDALLRADPRPIPENIQIIQADSAQVEKQVAESRRLFRAASTSRLDAGAFRKLLDDTIFDLTRRAATSRVTVPKDYNFTFSAQRVSVNFAPGSISRFVARLDDIKAIAQILFDSRVYEISSMRRSAASEEEGLSASSDLLVTKPATNAITGLVRYPYEVRFTGFTRELARVIDGFNKSSEFFVIRNLEVVPAPPPPVPVARPPGAAITAAQGAGQPRPAFPRPGAPGGGGNPDDPDDPGDDPSMNEDDPDMAAAAAPTAPQPGGPRFIAATTDTVLDEQLLQFTLTVDLIRVPAGAKAK